MKGRSFTIAAPIVSLIATASLIVASVAQENREKKPLAPEKYKNIKVLKSLPADELGPVMHKYNDALGVKCDFCHVIETTADGKHIGWEKDDKKMKEVARQMILMTDGINKFQKSVKNKVSCIMCHRGKKEPDLRMPEAKPEP